MGDEVALKAVAAGVLHKSDAGAVRLGLKGTEEVEHAARQMAEALEAAGHQVSGFQLQPMVPEGVEMLVGVVQDQHFGPVLACGAGGTATELLRDVAVRITPITRGDAHRMVRSLKTFPALDQATAAPRAPTSPRLKRCCCVSAPSSKRTPKSPRWISTRSSCTRPGSGGRRQDSAGPGRLQAAQIRIALSGERQVGTPPLPSSFLVSLELVSWA